MSKITLRKANTSEEAFLQNFSKDVINKNYREFLGDEAVDFFIGSGASDQYVQENIDETIVAIMEDKIVGMCVCKENLIDLIMIQNEWQNQGIGSDFINMVSEELLKTYPQIRVECFEKNIRANAFYLKNGWHQDKMVFDDELGDNRIYYTQSK